MKTDLKLYCAQWSSNNDSQETFVLADRVTTARYMITDQYPGDIVIHKLDLVSEEVLIRGQYLI